MKKLLTKTYLRDITEYKLKLFVDDNDFYVVVKHLVKGDKFVNFRGVCLMDEGFSIVEVVPKNENYAMRVFLNRENVPVEYYFDISLENGIDEDSKIPYYNDLYTDVIVLGDEIKVDDEHELKDALDKGVITKADFELANRTTQKLVDELKAGTNRFKNMDLSKYLNS